MKALILAAGLGTNLFPLTETRHKSMISICDKPVLQYTVEGLVESGIHDIIMVVGPHADTIKQHFGRGERFNTNIRYIQQDDPTSIGNAILLAEQLIPRTEHFYVVYADTLFERNIFKQMTHLNRLNPTAVAALTTTNRVHPDCDTATIDGKSRIIHITDRSKDDEDAGFVLAGVFIFDTIFFRILQEVQGNMSAALNLLVTRLGLLGSVFGEDWIDLGYPWNILDANKFLMRSYNYAKIAKTVKFEGNVMIDGPVHIGERVFIGSGSKINGPCYIGSDSYIGNNVLVRSNTSIGSGSTIGFGVELKNCVLFDRVKIGRLSFVGDSVVGEGVEIGSGIMTVNHPMTGETVTVTIHGNQIDSKLLKLGAFIGDLAKIGASNTIRPGALIPANDFLPHHVSV